MTTDTISTSDSCDELQETVNSVTTDEARTRLKDTLFSTLEAGENRLIDAPTSLGKSHRVATTSWREYPEVTGDSLVIHTHQTTDARDEAIEESKRAGVSYHVLEGRDDSCPVAAGDYDDDFKAPHGLAPSEWFDWRCDFQKAPFAKAHSKLDKVRDLPCTAQGECQSMKQWWEDLRDESGSPTVDVVHTTANFAHVEELIEGANLVFDERPNYALTLGDSQRQQLRDSLDNLLDYRSDGQFALLDVKNASLRDRPARQLQQLLEKEIDPDWYFRREETHRLAPAIGLAMLNADEVIEDRWAGTGVEFSGRWVGEHRGVRVVMNSKGKLRHVHYQPNFSAARCIIGLDAYPSVYRWQQNTVDDLQPVKVLSKEERRKWRQEERGLKVVQIGDATRSYTGGWRGAGKDRAAGLIRYLRQKHGEAFHTCITSKNTKDDVWRMMEEVGIEPPELMYYGGQNSLNDFKNELIGLLIGCIDPGDKVILDLLALGGCCAYPKVITTEEGEKERETGRTFDGPDSDVAVQLLVSVREHNLAQAAGRYARNPDSSSSSAKVYVWSDACPESLTDDILEASFTSLTGKQGELAEELQKESLQTARSLKNRVGMNKTYAIRRLEYFESQGIARRREGSGHQGADEWWWTGGDGEIGVLVALE